MAWFVNQTTFKDVSAIDGEALTFILAWPSADSMTVGNLAAAMMVRILSNMATRQFAGGGATGLIGDPDGKKQERDLLSLDEIAKNKAAIAGAVPAYFCRQSFDIVDNYEWFKGVGYLDFLREVCKHVPCASAWPRFCCQESAGQDGAGISYASSATASSKVTTFFISTEKRASRCKFAAPTNGAIVLRESTLSARVEAKKRTLVRTTYS